MDREDLTDKINVIEGKIRDREEPIFNVIMVESFTEVIKQAIKSLDSKSPMNPKHDFKKEKKRKEIHI